MSDIGSRSYIYVPEDGDITPLLGWLREESNGEVDVRLEDLSPGAHILFVSPYGFSVFTNEEMNEIHSRLEEAGEELYVLIDEGTVKEVLLEEDN